MHKCFEPIYNSNASKLILGTFPGRQSREKGEYYGNKNNSFWRIAAELFGQNATEQLSYEQKKRLLLDNNVALWDIINRCETSGSLDSEIQNPEFNDILGFVAKQGKIKTIIFNGKNAYKFYKKYLKANQTPAMDKINEVILPSTSGANAGMTYIEKLNIWKEELTKD